MTPHEFHNACLEALSECPQFDGYDDDMQFEGYGEFGNIPNKGWVKTIKFWKNENLLWDFGYYKCLPDEVQALFEKVDVLFEKAIKDACK